MDVIGDVTAPTVPVPDVPGEHEHKLSIGRPLKVMAFGALVGVVGLLCGAYLDNMALGWSVVVAAFVGNLGAMSVANGYTEQWLLLYRNYRQLRHYALMLSQQSAYQSGFISTYKPPQGDIDRLLAERAYKVLAAHERKVKLYARGAGDLMTRVHTDPEVEAHRLKDAADNKKVDVERDIKQSLENFRRARDLAKAQGYTAHESWKDYISPDLLPRQLKQSKPGTVFAEGRNEPAFEGETRVSGPQHAD